MKTVAERLLHKIDIYIYIGVLSCRTPTSLSSYNRNELLSAGAASLTSDIPQASHENINASRSTKSGELVVSCTNGTQNGLHLILSVHPAVRKRNHDEGLPMARGRRSGTLGATV